MDRSQIVQSRYSEIGGSQHAVVPNTQMKRLNGTALPEVEGKLNMKTKSNERRKIAKDVRKL